MTETSTPAFSRPIPYPGYARIVFYDTIPIENRIIQRHFAGPLRRFRCMEPYKFIHMLSNEEEYLYRVARLVELYITGKLKIRGAISGLGYISLPLESSKNND